MRYSILIVDDEIWALMGIKQFFLEHEETYTLVGEAFNGVDALELAKQEEPDIIVCDIRMPDLDGIELLAELKECGLHTKVILLSGYAEFEYARKAIQLGAQEYLLKPLDYDEMSAALDRTKKVIEEERKQISKIFFHMEQIFDLINPIENINFRQFAEKNGLRFPYHFYTVFVLSQEKKHMEYIIQEQSIPYQDFYYYRITMGKNKDLYIVNHKTDDSDFLIKNFQMFLKEYDLCGMSLTGSETENIDHKIEQAEIALEMGKLHHVPFMKYRENWDIFLKQEIYIDELSDLYNRYMFFMDKCDRTDQINNDEQTDDLQLAQYLEKENDFLFTEAESKAEVDKKNSEHYLIEKIMEDIALNYTKNITLNELAEKYFLNPSYLSCLIKKQTGENYSKHITGKRMEKAKELLKKTNLSVYEVGEQVGYGDYFYFTKIFKREIGMTPSKFRKNDN